MNGGFSPAWMPRLMHHLVVLAGIAFVVMLLALPSSAGAATTEPKTPMPPELLGFTPNTAPTNTDLRRMAEAGATTVRDGLSWSGMQPVEGGAIDWSGRDRFMVRASRFGLDVDFVLGTTPKWARSSPSASLWEPPLYSYGAKVAWTRFVLAAAERYGHGGSFWKAHPGLTYRPVTWTIWNEPNLERFWGGRQTPAGFAELVELAGGVIRDVDPEGTIVAGGIFCEWNWKPYLEAFYDTVDQSTFDAVAFHPYAENPNGPYRKMLQGRSIMDEAGDTDAEYWIDEISWGTDLSEDRFTTTPEKQATKMRILFQILEARRHRVDLGKVLWYGIRDDPRSNVCHFCATSGLWLEDGVTPKPAWFVYRGFGARPAAAIRGRVYSRHHHGPAAGQTVYLDLDENGHRQRGEPAAKTGADGRFSLERLFPTKYVVRLEPSKRKACKRPRNCTRRTAVASGKVSSSQRFVVMKARTRTKITAARVTRFGKAKFRFKGSRANFPYTYKCKLDRKPYRRCRSPKVYRHLRSAAHTFKVRATDHHGNLDRTPAKERFTIRR
jgi:hypothetical protein